MHAKKNMISISSVAIIVLLTIAFLIPANGDEFDLNEALSQPVLSGGYWRLVADDVITYQPAWIKPELLDNIVYFPETALLPNINCNRDYDVSTRTYSVYRDENILSFNVDTGLVLTSDGRSFFARAFSLNNQYYIPYELILREFGCTLEMLENGTPRLLTGQQRLNAHEMQAVMDTMTAFRSGVVDRPPIHIMIRGGGAGVERMARSLESYGQRAAFCFTSADVQNRPKLLRDLYVAGHSIGIYSESATLSEIERTNLLIERVIKTKTAIVLVPSRVASGDLLNEGYAVWNYSLAVDAVGTQVSLTNVLANAGWRVVLFLDGTAQSADRLAALLSGLQGRDQRLVLPTEVLQPYR